MDLQFIFSLLTKCNEAYSNGEVYILSEIEKDKLLQENIDIPSLEVVDTLYDSIYYRAKEEDPNNIFFKKLTSLNIGYGEEIKHSEPMGSMDELKSGDWDKWKIGHDKFLLSEKLDGCSLVLYYKNGILDKAATRGHGYNGKDITRHIQYVSNIPLTIQDTDDLIVRGELLCPKADIEKMLAETEKITGKKQKNGRNTIAGALNRKETQSYIFNKAKFIAYWDSKDKGLALSKLKTYKFDIPNNEYINSTYTEDELIDKVKNYINSSRFEIDGLILTQADNIQEGFETGTINPRASRKFKIGITDNVAVSRVVNIDWQVSKNKKLCPVLEIQPTDVAGCTVTHITGHNYQNVINKKCGIGSKVRFSRAGLVIPYLQEVLEPSEDYNLNFKYEQRGVDIYVCDDIAAIKEANLRKLEFFAKSLDIDQLGYANCKALFEYFEAHNEELTTEYLCTSVSEEIFHNVIGINGNKIYKSLREKLQNITEVEYAAASGAFGPAIGKRILQSVWDKYNTLVVTENELRQVEGFGETRLKQYLEYVNTWQNTVNVLTSYVVFNTASRVLTSNKFADKIVCFSGIRDKDLMLYINQNGGDASDTWKKDTNILVVKDMNSTSSKMKKAKTCNCLILDLESAKNYFGG